MELTQEEYTESDGTQCPSCKSGNVSHGRFDDMMLTRPSGCLDCKYEWDECFKLAGYLD